jgi:hypothetical protein
VVKFLVPGAARIEVLVRSTKGLGAGLEFKLQVELEIFVEGRRNSCNHIHQS